MRECPVGVSKGVYKRCSKNDLNQRYLLYLVPCTLYYVLMHVQHIPLQPCVPSPKMMTCTAPRLSGEGFNQTSRQLRIGLLMDGVSSLLELNSSLALFPNPSFNSFGEELMFNDGDPISLEIQGSGFVFSTEQVRVEIEPCKEEVCQCRVSNVFQHNNVSKSVVVKRAS